MREKKIIFTWSLYNVYWGGGVSGGYGGGNCQMNGSPLSLAWARLPSGIPLTTSTELRLQVVVAVLILLLQRNSALFVDMTSCPTDTTVCCVDIGVAVCTTDGSVCASFTPWSSRLRNLLRTSRIAIIVPLLPTILYFRYSRVSFFATLEGIFKP